MIIYFLNLLFFVEQYKKGERMNKKITLLATVITFAVIASMIIAQPASAAPAIKRPMEIIEATIQGGNPATVDPAVAYDTASGGLLIQVYDTLLTFDAEHMENYLPALATSYTVTQYPAGTKSPEGLDWTFVYDFKIRTGVKFQNESYTLTPADVEYSIEREMVMDAAGGPQWMFYEPLLYGEASNFINQEDLDLTNPATIVTVGKMIDHSVESNATDVWFNIAWPGAYKPFLQILCQTWAGILSKGWINDYVIGTLGRPDWNGVWGDYSGWINFNAPDVSPLDDPTPVMMGCGPFSFETLDQTAQFYKVNRFVDYWRGWPLDFPKLGSAKPAGYVNDFVETWAYTNEARYALFLSGDVDFCAIQRADIAVVNQKPGIRLIYPLPTLAVDALFYNFFISPTSPYGPFNAAGIFSESAIPTDFFGNATWGKNVRRAFSYSIDYNTFIQDAYQGEATHPPTALIPTLPFYNASQPGFTFDLTKAAAEFHLVPGLWDTGFTITLTYNSGNLPRQLLCENLKRNIESLNAKFHCNIASADWSAYLAARTNRQLTAFTLGWLADFPDAHNFAQPFYASFGNFAARQSYSNPVMDDLINQGISEVNDTKRNIIYGEIQALAIADCPSAALDSAIGRHYEQDWVTGWYYNPIYPDNYIANLWKWFYIPHASSDATPAYPQSYRLPCDVNYDGKVNIVDITIVAQAFGSNSGPPIHPRWQFRADINNDRKVDIIDISAVASNFGKTPTAVWTAST
jgi:peptide/nickel transport system substrate-binding protein